jgi:hypothetical protein
MLHISASTWCKKTRRGPRYQSGERNGIPFQIPTRAPRGDGQYGCPPRPHRGRRRSVRRAARSCTCPAKSLGVRRGPLIGGTSRRSRRRRDHVGVQLGAPSLRILQVGSGGEADPSDPGVGGDRRQLPCRRRVDLHLARHQLWEPGCEADHDVRLFVDNGDRHDILACVMWLSASVTSGTVWVTDGYCHDVDQSPQAITARAMEK